MREGVRERASEWIHPVKEHHVSVSGVEGEGYSSDVPAQAH